MTTIEIKDASGKKAGSADLAATVFGIEPNMTVMHTVVRSQRAAWRQGTSNTLTRGQARRRQEAVAPEGHRPCPPGTIRAPVGGGGTVFGPHPRSYASGREQGGQAGDALRALRQAWPTASWWW